jgi:heme exporter protein B
VLVIFAFVFNAGSNPSGNGDYSAAILWIALIFASVIGLNQAFATEKENACLRGLLLCPVDRSVIYLGKLLASLTIILLAEIITIPVFIALFGISCNILDFILIILLSTLGLSIVGTLFSAISSASRLREVLFPVLFFPVIIPLAIASVGATSALFEGKLLGDVLSWLNIIVAFDVLFVVISLLVFEATVEGS